MAEPIAIIGMGCRFPGGADTPSKLWSVISNPDDLSREPASSRFNIGPFYHPVGTHHGTTNASKSYWLEDDARSNVAHFDAGFFNIQAGEADSIDPQQRLLMEVVYDSLCAAGQPIERLRGSDTAVVVGSMCDDYNTMLVRDWETLPRYAATGLQRGILSNRVSYFFDWHGPSLSVDTACSSSLVALDHGVQLIRSGRSKVAIAAGTSLILSPAMHIAESNLGMLSPSGRCAMWDIAADGYARGEGVAAVVLKSLSQALADNDPIDCIIRETGVNQDGRTPGLTMPGAATQADLIRRCYAMAGLDPINNPQDRPQFFQAHGTGTQAGDPQESHAISSALFPRGSPAELSGEKLLVGSVKTVIGHTEGTAGLAGVISTSLAMKHGIIPPNLHFRTLNPKVEPYFKHLDIPTKQIKWPTSESQIKRASVNSFGFGGTNAHCILEQVQLRAPDQTASDHLFTPLTFSAASPTALRATLSSYLEFLMSNSKIVMADLAYTLQHRRSTLPYRKTVAGDNIESIIKTLQDTLEVQAGTAEETSVNTRFSNPQNPQILGIFTGQGAQWPRMGAKIIECSQWASSRLAELDEALQTLPREPDRPNWTLKDQLCAAKDSSRIAEAAFSQPLCTAAQILLVDILKEAGILFTAVVGHSSGEIGAAYAAGLLSGQDAIRVAYYRGVYAKLASSPKPKGPRGGMMAIGASAEDAQAICEQASFVGRLQVAAVNSSSSVTISGDEDAIDEAEELLKSQGMFARKLKVDTAYHSAHMQACAGPYLEALANCAVKPLRPGKYVETVWYSSAYEGVPMTVERLTNQYWVDNMCSSVWFAGALSRALQAHSTFDVAIEVGPHPALKGPAMATVESMYNGKVIPYTGVLSRGADDIVCLGDALGQIWTRLGSGSIQFHAVQALLSGIKHKTVLQDLPPYPFDHQRTFWISSRVANYHKYRSPRHVTNPLLGNPCSEAATPGEFQWRKILQPSELPWLKGHMLQGQMVFPATGYVSMAVEAINSITLDQDASTKISLIHLQDIEIPRALAFDDDSANIEMIFSVSSVKVTDQKLSASWACYSAMDGSAQMTLNANGRIECSLSLAEPDTLPLIKTDAYGLVKVAGTHFYENLASIGYGYAAPFQGLGNIRRKLGYSTGFVTDQSGSGWVDDLALHPGMLDSALQALFAAWSYPGDTSIWSLHVPVSITGVTINPYFTALGGGGKQTSFGYESFIRSVQPSKVVGDIYLHTKNNAHAALHLEGVTLVPFARATPKNDLPIFSTFKYNVDSPNGQLAAASEAISTSDVQIHRVADRASYWFIRNAAQLIPLTNRDQLPTHSQKYLSWCDRMVDMISQNMHPHMGSDCNMDTREDISLLLASYEERKDLRCIETIGDNLISVLNSDLSMTEHLDQHGLLRALQEDNGLCYGPTGRWLARVMSQITHRFPNLNILEIGAGTGAVTQDVLREISDTYSSYTFTDTSGGLFTEAEQRFSEAGRMVFKTLDIETPPSTQGFSDGSYDVLIAANVLYLSSDIEKSLLNARRLLKPGGFLVLRELTSNESLFMGMTMGVLTRWWADTEAGQKWGPSLTLSQWDSALKKSGFAGIDTMTPELSGSLPMHVFVAQAINDQVMILRDPLAVKERPSGVRNDGLAIIGGSTLRVRKLGQDVAGVLTHRFSNKQFFDTLEDFAVSELAKPRLNQGSVTILSLLDLDEPYLENLTSKKFAALKTLWATAGTLIWVTCGLKKDKPYSRMMKGIIETVKSEHPNLSFQIYDLEFKADSRDGIQPDTATNLAAALLTEHAMHEWGPDEDLLWTSEPEVYLSGNARLITRLVPDSEKNDRYNSSRRDVFAEVSLEQDTIELAGIREGNDRLLELQKVSPLRLSESAAITHRSVLIKHSLLQTLAIHGVGFLRLCLGVDENSGEIVLALAGSSESRVKVLKQWTIALSEQPTPAMLLSVATNLIAEHILSFTPRSSTLLVHDPDPALKAVLETKAKTRNVHTIFTTSELQHSEDEAWIYLHPNMPQRVIQAAIPASVTVFLFFSKCTSSDALKGAIVDRLPSTCRSLTESNVLSHKVDAFTNPQESTSLIPTLQSAFQDIDQVSSAERSCLSLTASITRTVLGEPLAIVDWTLSKSVIAKVQPIDSGILFSAEKTYLFAGMAGELGQSLAAWMIRHGARNVVLTSRNPKVNSRFIADMANNYGATVKAMPLDITSRNSLNSVLTAIRATLPPIGGVVNGAMVLEDELFANMSLESFEHVTAPKAVGTQILDQAFEDDASLDFFIVTSSISTLIGWSGQSNYAAANEYMTCLMYNRQARGVAGSVMNIPAVLGSGVAANTDFDFDYFQSIGYTNIGEEDLHILFAETILSGRPGSASHVQPQVGMGINFLPSDFEVKAAHKRGIKFSRFVQRDAHGTNGLQADKTEVRVKVQLQAATSAEECFTIIRDAFLAHLRRLFRISEDASFDDSASLVDQGLDSLVAVDIRSWFLKELKADVPTLKILGGGSIAELVSIVVEKTFNSPDTVSDADDIVKEDGGSSGGSDTSLSTPAPRSPGLDDAYGQEKTLSPLLEPVIYLDKLNDVRVGVVQIAEEIA